MAGQIPLQKTSPRSTIKLRPQSFTFAVNVDLQKLNSCNLMLTGLCCVLGTGCGVSYELRIICDGAVFIDSFYVLDALKIKCVQYRGLTIHRLFDIARCRCIFSNFGASQFLSISFELSMYFISERTFIFFIFEE